MRPLREGLIAPSEPWPAYLSHDSKEEEEYV